MARVYFGYRMVDGNMVIHTEEAEQLAVLYESYVLGKSITVSGEKACIQKPHGPLGRMLCNKVYVGTSVYPSIISQEVFEQAQEERQQRNKRLGRNFELTNDQLIISTAFKWRGEEIQASDSFEIAEQLYQSIEVIR